MAAAITERHEVVVETETSTFVLTADSREGRLVIKQMKKGRGGHKEVCALTLANPSELEDFFEGLRRLLGQSAPLASPPAPKQGSLFAQRTVSARNGGAGGEGDRDEAIARARERNPSAFEPWSKAEEQELRARFESGTAIEEIARAHNRSPKAIRMRLERLGLLSPN